MSCIAGEGIHRSWRQTTNLGPKPTGSCPNTRSVCVGEDNYWLVGHGWNTYYGVTTTMNAFGLVGCVFLTLFLSLLIAGFFPKYHNMLASKATSPGSRRLYWGTTVTSLFLAFILLLGKMLYLCFYLHALISYNDEPSSLFYIVMTGINIAVEILIPLVFLPHQSLLQEELKLFPCLLLRSSLMCSSVAAVFFAAPHHASQKKCRS